MHGDLNEARRAMAVAKLERAAIMNQAAARRDVLRIEWAPFRNRLDQAVARQSRFCAAGRPHRRYTAILAIA